MTLLNYLIHFVSLCNQTYSQICITSQHVKSWYLKDFWIIQFCFWKNNVDKCASHFTLLFWEWDEHRVVSILHRKISAPRWMYIFAFIYESENKYAPPFCNRDLCWIFHYEKLWYLTLEYQTEKTRTGKAFRLISKVFLIRQIWIVKYFVKNSH